MRCFNNECVVLLHGLGRTKRSMKLLQAEFEKHGFVVKSIGYKSRHFPINTMASEVFEELSKDKRLYSYDMVHFIGHSLGSIVIRKVILREYLPNLGRVILLAPPNNGAKAAQLFLCNPIAYFILGHVGKELANGIYLNKTCGTTKQFVSLGLGRGLIITGNQNLTWWDPVSWITTFLLKKPHDGKVTLEESLLPGTDHISVDCNHMLIMRHKKTIEEASMFIRSVTATKLLPV